MRQRAPRAENSLTRGKSGVFVADSCCRLRAMRVKAFANRVLQVVVNRTSTYFRHVSDLN